jgi:NAD(P)-dependent dehydrogenase (short-subunit alcohol dehydrogenase family)
MTSAAPGPSDGHLEGRVVVVTGGARGIGLAIARAAATEGAKVVIADVGAEVRHGRDGDAEAALQAAAEIRGRGGTAVAYTADIATTEGADGAVALAVRRFGGVDGIVCCAGNLVQAELAECADADWDETVRVHLRGNFACARAATQAMIRQGRGGSIVLCSSLAAVVAPGDMPAYAAAKAGILGLTASAARSTRHHGIRVNAILPAAATRMSDELRANASGADTRGRSAPSSAVQGTVHDPANVAPFAILLLGDRLDTRTGEAFAVTGYQVTVVEPVTWGSTIRSDGPWDLDDLAQKVERDLVPMRAPEIASWPPV